MSNLKQFIECMREVAEGERQMRQEKGIRNTMTFFDFIEIISGAEGRMLAKMNDEQLAKYHCGD